MDPYLIGRQVLYKELQPLFEQMAIINYAVIKGEALSQYIYGVPNRRRSSDIDILINKKDIKFVENELQKLGFSQKEQSDAEMRSNRIICMAYSHQIPSYRKLKYGFRLSVDINFDIFWGEYEGERYDMDQFLNDAKIMEIYGVSVKTLTLEKMFVQLILHHYKEMNSLYHLSFYNCIRTYLFKDIYDFLIEKKEDLSAEKVRGLCEKYKIGNIVYYMIFYTYQVFRDEELKKLIDSLCYYKDEKLLKSFGLCKNERKTWEISFKDRLDNDDLWNLISASMTLSDRKK